MPQAELKQLVQRCYGSAAAGAGPLGDDFSALLAALLEACCDGDAQASKQRAAAPTAPLAGHGALICHGVEARTCRLWMTNALTNGPQVRSRPSCASALPAPAPSCVTAR